jgi:DNA helicase-2/ATP-dependent DNA helicase PcrA
MMTPPPQEPELNEPQAEAVAHVTGPLLVFAGAGSGKTRVITYRVANLLAQHRIAPYRILAVTFTNKAAGELRKRLCALVGEELTQDLWVGTFHSICARFLRRYHDAVGLDRGYSIYDDADQKVVVSRVLDGLGVDDRVLPPKRMLSRIHAWKRDGVMPDDVAPESASSVEREVYAGYQAALLGASAVDFDDLLLHVARLLEDTESDAARHLRGRFDHVLVDEFQDTNAVQYRMVRALAEAGRNLCVVGDDDQSIYRWRGADVGIIRGFKRDFPDARVVKLEQNYRSTGNIVACALGVIAPAYEREPKRLWTARSAGDPVVVRKLPDERAEARHVVALLQKALDEGVPASELAVFYRVHAQSRVLEEGLRSARIPYQVVGGMKFFERAEIKDVIAYLRLIDNPKSDADLLRIINVPTRGIGGKTVERIVAVASRDRTSLLQTIETLAQSSEFGAAVQKKLVAFQHLMQGFRNAALGLTVSELAEMVLDRTGYRAALADLGSVEADARLGNLQELLGSMGEHEAEMRAEGQEPRLSDYLERVALVSAIDERKDLPQVSLMTVHAAKGLEFEVVVLTGMEEEVFPYRGVHAEEIDELEEERRLMYVAVTRARRRLTITHVAQRTLFGTTRYLLPSRFLTSLPVDSVCRMAEAASSQPSWAEPARWGGPSSSRRSGPRSHAPEPQRSPGERFLDASEFNDLPEESGVRLGSAVHHEVYGRGRVVRVNPGSPPLIVVHFPDYGERRIRADFLTLA